MRRIRVLLKMGLLLSLLMVFSLLVAYKVASAPVKGDSLLRVEVREPNGASVDVSVPLSVLSTVFDVLPRDLRRLCDEADHTAEAIVSELQKMDGQDLVCITGEEHVRVYLVPITPDNQDELGFVKVHVKEGHGHGHGHEVRVCIPRGLVRLTGGIIKQLGIVDKFVELPPEIEELVASRATE